MPGLTTRMHALRLRQLLLLLNGILWLNGCFPDLMTLVVRLAGSLVDRRKTPSTLDSGETYLHSAVRTMPAVGVLPELFIEGR